MKNENGKRVDLLSHVSAITARIQETNRKMAEIQAEKDAAEDERNKVANLLAKKGFTGELSEEFSATLGFSEKVKILAFKKGNLRDREGYYLFVPSENVKPEPKNPRGPKSERTRVLPTEIDLSELGDDSADSEGAETLAAE